jgi:hypothetical protein
VFTHCKLRTSALSKFVTPLAHRFVSNKGTLKTEANGAVVIERLRDKGIGEKRSRAFISAILAPSGPVHEWHIKRSGKRAEIHLSLEPQPEPEPEAQPESPSETEVF